MGAYNKQGQLIRVVQAAREKAADSRKKEEQGGGRQQQFASNDNDNLDAKKDVEIPPETARDHAPFPMNRTFISQPVLTSALQHHIWRQIIHEGKSVREVSAEVNVEMSRVAAVVRLLEIEHEWKRIGKPLAQRYHDAVQSMLPKTDWAAPEWDAEHGEFAKREKPNHESINDLPVHAATGQQIFLPTSESRHFTRADAAKVFDKRLLPADDRVPHPELTVMHKEVLEGLSEEERRERAEARNAVAERKRAAALALQAAKEAAIKKVDTGRWEYRFTEIKVDDAGKDGRGLGATGWRYGAPLMDRSRGQHKIPRAV
jgi:hypothetical protein